MSKFDQRRRTRSSHIGSANGFAYMPTVVRTALNEEALSTDTPAAPPAEHSDSWEGFDIPADEEDDLPFPDLGLDGDTGDRVSSTPREPFMQSTSQVELHAVMRSLAPAPLPSMPVPSAILSSFPPAESPSTRASTVMKDHPLWSIAQMSIALNKKDDALGALEQLYLQDPNHESGRMELFRLAAELERHPLVAAHASWALSQYTDSGRHEEACLIYRGVRTTFAEVVFTEDALVAILRSADANQEGALVLDATNLLLRLAPQGPHTARALLTTAKHQLLAGAEEAAINTLKYLIGSHPSDPAAEPARRKLAEFGIA
jgi:hypothetical protein